MAMGDLVLLPDEVNPVVRALQAGGLDVLAIHNHLIGESPQVIYVHFGGHGPREQVAKALRAALDTTKTPLAAPGGAPRVPVRRRNRRVRRGPGGARPQGHDGRPCAPGRRAAGREDRGGRHGGPGRARDGDGAELPGRGRTRVATTGDFVLTGDEVNPVIRELEAHGIQVTALHSHMLRETPRLFFMHFWGLDDPPDRRGPEGRAGQGRGTAVAQSSRGL